MVELFAAQPQHCWGKPRLAVWPAGASPLVNFFCHRARPGLCVFSHSQWRFLLMLTAMCVEMGNHLPHSLAKENGIADHNCACPLAVEHSPSEVGRHRSRGL